MAQGSSPHPARGTARKASEAASKARRRGPVVSVAHAASYLDVSRQTVYRLIEAKELTAFRVAGHDALRVALSDLDAYLDRKAVAS